MTTRVVDTEHDGGSLLFRFGTTEIPMLKCSYSDSLEPEMGHEMGSQEQDFQTDGTYKTETAKFTMRRSVFTTLWLPAFPRRGAGNQRFTSHIIYDHPEIGKSEDVLVRSKWIKAEASLEASNKATEVQVELNVRQIFWNGRTINRIRRGGGPTGILTL